MARLIIFAALWLSISVACEASVQRSSLRGQRLLSRSQSEAEAKSNAPGCDCALCLGERRVNDMPTSGFKGLQCKPRSSAVKIRYCQQQGKSEAWVVQSAKAITYDRFCYFTCKPVIAKEINPNIKCTQLTHEEAQRGQTPSGNGRAFMWHSNPITDSITLSSLQIAPQNSPDATENLIRAVATVQTAVAARAAKAAILAAEARAKSDEEPPKASPCMCRCPLPPTTPGPLPPYNPFRTPPPLPAAPPKPPGLPPPPPPPPVPPPSMPAPPPLPPLPLVLPAPAMGGFTASPPAPPTLQPTPAPNYAATTTFKWPEPAPTTPGAPYFAQPFPERFMGEASNKPLGPFAPTMMPGVAFAQTTPMPLFQTTPMSPFGAAPAPAGAFGAFATTPSPYGAFGTTRRPFLLLADLNSGDDGALPPLPPLPAALPLPSLPGMTASFKHDFGQLSFLQEGAMSGMTAAFSSSIAIPGCGCHCAKRQSALMQAQENALHLMAFPEDGEPTPWGHAL